MVKQIINQNVQIIFFSIIICLNFITSKYINFKVLINNIGNKTEEAALTATNFSKLPNKEIDPRLLGINLLSNLTLEQNDMGYIPMSLPNKLIQYDYGYSPYIYQNPPWPSNEIPYIISNNYAPAQQAIIKEAFTEFHKRTCIRFVPRRNYWHKNYIYIYPQNDCGTVVGFSGGEHFVNLAYRCLKRGIILHELMHVLGFNHEMSRFDRDLYVDIKWSNIIKKRYYQFLRFPKNYIDELNEPYDYDSIMHYDSYAFSANRKPTIYARNPNAKNMGQRQNLSIIDVKKVNKLYKCSMQYVNQNFYKSLNTSPNKQKKVYNVNQTIVQTKKKKFNKRVNTRLNVKKKI